AGSHTAHQRHQQLRQGGRSLIDECGGWRLDGWTGVGKPYAARSTGAEFDGAFAGQGLEMVFGGVGRLEAQGTGDFRPGGREARAGDFAADELKNLLLTLGKLDGHGYPDCVYIQSGFCSISEERSSTKKCCLSGCWRCAHGMPPDA